MNVSTDQIDAGGGGVITPPAAAAELLARRQARTRLIDFARYITPTYRADVFHRYLADALDRVATGEIKRLIVSAPPQHGKSALSSEHFPAYYLGHHPNSDIIISSYTLDLAAEQSDKARSIVSSPAYKNLFPTVALRGDRRAVQRWKLESHSGGVRAAGVGGGISGYPAVLGIIDDPFKDWEDAYSAARRELVWNWFNSTFYTRVAERGAMIVIATRWHEDDLIGRLIQRDGAEWTVLRLPALAETQAERDSNNRFLGLPEGQPDPMGRAPGEARAPSRFSQSYLENVRVKNARVFSALYQGVPRPAEGNRIKRSWLPISDAAPPAQARRIRYWDKAGSDGRGAYTAGVLVAAAADGVIYIEDVVRGQWSAYERERIIRQTAELDAERHGSKGAVHIWIEQEPGSGGKESAENTIRNLVGFVIRADRPTGNKDVRLEPFAAQAEAGNVRLLRGKWNLDYIEELVSIPNGTYRDQSDATSGAFNKLTAVKTFGGMLV